MLQNFGVDMGNVCKFAVTKTKNFINCTNKVVYNKININNMRIIGKIILLLSPIFLRFQCDKEDLYYRGVLYVKNCTDHNLYLDYPPYGIKQYNSFKQYIASGDSLWLWGAAFSTEYSLIFDAVLSEWREAAPPANYQDKEACRVLSVDNQLLRQWNYTDRNLPGKQFFKETLWRCYHFLNENTNSRYEVHKRTVWVFDILPEDIKGED